MNTTRAPKSKQAPDRIRLFEISSEQGGYLKSTNPLESIFAGVRLRTDAINIKRMRTRDSALFLVFKIVERLSEN